MMNTRVIFFLALILSASTFSFSQLRTSYDCPPEVDCIATTLTKELSDTTDKQFIKLLKKEEGSLAYKTVFASPILRKNTNFLKRICKYDQSVLETLSQDLENPKNSALKELLEARPALVDYWKRMHDYGADDMLRNNPGVLDVLSKAKGSRPDPSTYLDADYIANHLAKFNNGASSLLTKSSFDTYGVGKPDPDKTEFVTTKSEMDDILSLPREQQAERLGIPFAQFKNDALIRVDFKPTNKIEMPSGNEWEANDQWIPGGKTSGGVDEAIVKTDGMQLNIDYTLTEL